MHRLKLWLSAVSTLLVLIGCSQPSAPDVPTAAQPQAKPVKTPTKFETAHLPNTYRLTEKVFSGGQPEGEAGFQELQRLGIKTVISVDGARPDLELAKQYDLRYIHLPHGYDGIPDERVRELAKAVRDLPGSIYIHCHHGKHRSPAAATVACVGAGLLDPADALGVLKAAGTSNAYRGLFHSAESARRFDDQLLDALHVEFQSAAKLPPLAEAMVTIEKLHDRLQEMAQRDWRSSAASPTLTPSQTALLLKEQFAELLRTDVSYNKSERFRQLLQASERAAGELESLLPRGSETQEADAAQADLALQRITRQCATCHQTVRDIPLTEKGR